MTFFFGRLKRNLSRADENPHSRDDSKSSDGPEGGARTRPGARGGGRSVARRGAMGRGGVTCSAVNDSVPGLGSAPPWDFRLRPRGGLGQDGKTMVQYRGAPWKPPKQLDSSGRLNAQGPPDFFQRYMRLTQLPPRDGAVLSKPAGLQGTSLEQCDENPGVALDRSNNKYKILMVENGIAKTVGRFHVYQEGMEAISGYNDMQTKGPLGIAGVPGSIGNMGPPGIALLPKLSWQANARNRPQIDEGNCNEFANKEPELAAERFSYHRRGAEMANQEQVVARDTFEGKGRHAAARHAAKDILENMPPNVPTPPGTSYNKIYDERGLTLASGRHSVEPYAATNSERMSLAFSMAKPNNPLSFRNVPFRPASSLLKDKGIWNGRAPDHNKSAARVDLLSNLNGRGFACEERDQKVI